MTSLIVKLLPEHLPELDSDDCEEIAYLLYCWNLGIFDHNGFNREVKNYCGKYVKNMKFDKKFRDWLSKARWNTFFNFDVVRLKLISVRAFVLRAINRGDLCRLFYQAGVPMDCVKLITYLIESPDHWKLMLERCNNFAEPDVLNDLEYNAENLIEQCGQDFAQRKVFDKAYFLANRKLRFIWQYNNYCADDIANDLIIHAVSYYYRVRPFLSRLHAVNYAKSSIHGRSQQLIAHYTLPDYSRLVDNDDKYGFTPTIISGYDTTDIMTSLFSGTAIHPLAYFPNMDHVRYRNEIHD